MDGAARDLLLKSRRCSVINIRPLGCGLWQAESRKTIMDRLGSYLSHERFSTSRSTSKFSLCHKIILAIAPFSPGTFIV